MFIIKELLRVISLGMWLVGLLISYSLRDTLNDLWFIIRANI